VLPGVTDFVIKENYIIASLANHIITVDITSFDNSMITAMLDQPSVNGAGRYPHFDFDGRFECVDLSKGIVMGWERRNVVNPECQKLN
jgi:hypothetical protein